MHAQEKQKPGLPAHSQNGYNNIKKQVEHLACPEDQMVVGRHPGKGRTDYFLSKILLKILEEYPNHRAERIQKRRIKMLQAMGWHPALRAAHTDKGAFGNVIVDTIDICIGMV